MKMGDTVLIRSAGIEGIVTHWLNKKPGYVNVRAWVEHEGKYIEFKVHPSNLQNIYRSGAAMEINTADPHQNEAHFLAAYDLALGTNDKEWFNQLSKMRQGKKAKQVE